MRRNVVEWSIVALAAATIGACEDRSPVGPVPDGPAVPEPPVVSQAPDLGALRVSASRGLSNPAPATFLSLPPGSVTRGTALRIRTADGATRRLPLVEGGLDPAAVPALPGDQLSVEILDGTSVLGSAMVPVLPMLPPIVIRTDPPQRRTSVPVNAMLTIVFSEPVAPASVTGETVRLAGAGADVPVTLTLRFQGTVVEVRPLAPLRYSTSYTLEIGTGVADLSGDHLVEAQSVDFQTETCTPADTTPFAVRLLPDTLTLPVGSGSGFIVAVDSGARIINAFPDPSLTWASSDSAIARPLNGAVDALAIGEAYITVEYAGDVDSALVIVTESPPPGPFGIFPGGAMIPIGFTYQFEVSHPAGTAAPTVTWSSTDAAIFTVDASGTVTALAAGIAQLVAVAGPDVDTADIEVYDPTPPLGSQFAVTPDSLLLQVGDVRQMGIVGVFWPEPPVTWSTGNAAVASISTQGALRAEGPGSTDVVATFDDGSTATTPVEVVAAGTLGQVALVPAGVTASVGDTVRFTLHYDATALANYGQATVAWGTVSPGVQVLRYLAGGVFEVLAAGSADVTAYVGPLIARATVTATAP